MHQDYINSIQFGHIGRIKIAQKPDFLYVLSNILLCPIQDMMG